MKHYDVSMQMSITDNHDNSVIIDLYLEVSVSFEAHSHNVQVIS